MKNISTIVPWLLLGAAIIILITLFNRSKDSIDYKELIKAKDETIQAIARERDAYREMKDEVIRELQEKDSLLQLRVKTNTIRYEKIPVIVGNLSDDQLRSAVESYR